MNHHGRAMRAALALVVAIGLTLSGCATTSSKPASPTVEALTTTGDAEKARVVIQGSQPLEYTAFRLSDPPRVVIDIPGVTLGKTAGSHPSAAPLVQGVTAAEVTEGASRVGRIEVAVDPSTSFTVTPDASAHTLTVELSAGTARPADSADAAAPEAAEPAPTLDAALARAPAAPSGEAVPPASALTTPVGQPPGGEIPAVTAAETPAVPAGPPAIRKITPSAAGGSTELLIEASAPITRYKAFRLPSPPRLVLDIQDAKNQTSRRRVAVGDRRVQTVRLGSYQSKVRVVLDLAGKGDIAYQVSPDPRGLLVTVRPKAAAAAAEAAPVASPAAEAAPAPSPSPAAEAAGAPTPAAAAEAAPVPPVPLETATAPSSGPAAPTSVEPTAQAEAESPAAPEPAAQVGRPGDGGLPLPPGARPRAGGVALRRVGLAQQPFVIPDSGKRYTGRRLSLDFKDADIDNILRLIAEISNLNIVTGDDVKGKISLRLINVPWDQALDIVLESQGLGMIRTGNVVRIAPAGKLKAEDDAAIAAKAAKQKLEDLTLEIIPVNYATAADMEKQLKGLLTDRGKITVDTRTNALIVSDVKGTIEQARALIVALDTTTPQVLIEARIVEASLDFTRELGIQWGGTYNGSPATGLRTGNKFPGTVNANGGAGSNFAINLPAAIGAGAGGGLNLLLGSLNSVAQLDVRLSALERTGEGRLISSPKITTLDNKEAVIEQGLSIPFETTSQSGTQTTFIDANLNLTVTPHVTNDESISLKIKASKNAPDTSVRGASGAPSISKKEARTEVLIKNGQTTVIGGIYQIDRSETVAGLPWFHRIPIFGWLFKKTTVVDKKTELLIFITPRIVRPAQQAASR
jgi:type IV pilus assembly protein PilQ